MDEYAAIAEWDVSTRQTNEGFIRRTIKPALGPMKVRKVRGPILDKLYAELKRCGDLSCTGRPFIEHRNVPVLTVNPRDRRPAWQQVAAMLAEARPVVDWAGGRALHLSQRARSEHWPLTLVYGRAWASPRSGWETCCSQWVVLRSAAPAAMVLIGADGCGPIGTPTGAGWVAALWRGNGSGLRRARAAC